MRTVEDKQKLRDFKADIFNESIPIEETVRKYFPVVQGSETDFNIAYYNVTCERIAEKTRKRLGKRGAYEVGESLVCKSSYLKVKR